MEQRPIDWQAVNRLFQWAQDNGDVELVDVIDGGWLGDPVATAALRRILDEAEHQGAF